MTKIASKKQKKRAQPDKVLIFVKRSATVFVLIITAVFVGANAYFSASVPPLFARLSAGVTGSDIQILSQSKNTQEFAGLLPEIQTILSRYHSEIYKDVTDRNDQKTKLLKLHAIQPNSPELLYGLYILSMADKETEKAREYLQMAREIDPHIGL